LSPWTEHIGGRNHGIEEEEEEELNLSAAQQTDCSNACVTRRRSGRIEKGPISVGPFSFFDRSGALDCVGGESARLLDEPRHSEHPLTLS
jgi:hypothetical protein